MQHKIEHMKEIRAIFKSENLMSLSDNDYQYKDLNVLLLSTSNTPQKNKGFKKFNSIKNEWDLLNCNNDLKLLTAHLYYYRPIINNPTKEFYIYNGNYTSTYFQNEPDWFYSTHVSCCFEKLYNFWDRIGDALAYYLNLEIKEWTVDFAKVIDLMSKDESYSNNKYFQSLLEFKNTKFTEFNLLRKDIVHYYQFETTFRWEHTMNCSNKNSINELW